MSNDDKLFNFLIFDQCNNLVYSKYSFDFINYAKDNNLNTRDKYFIFNNFYQNNGSTFDEITSIKDKYKKYFFPICEHNEIIPYIKKYGVLHKLWTNYSNIETEINYFEPNQFDLFPYSDFVCIQDFFYYTIDGDILSKYNFNFEKYSFDWKIPVLSKNLVFTDFIFRNYKLSQTEQYKFTPVYNLKNGFVVLPEFVKYFYKIVTNLQKDSLYNYLAYQAPSSNPASEKYYLNINWENYIKDNTITPTQTIDEAKIHFIENGQYEYRKITYDTVIDNSLNLIKNVVGSVYSNNSFDTQVGTGFLFSNNDGNIYFISSYSLIEKLADKNNIFVIFENEIKNSIALFKIIGFDEATNIMVSVIDFDNPYNLNFVSNINNINISISNFYTPSFAETLYVCGNINLDDNLSIITTTIINSSYMGGFNDNIDVSMPDLMLLQSPITNISSGSPVFSKKNGDWEIVGIINKNDNIHNNHLKNTITSNKNILMINIIQQIVRKWKYLKFTINNDPLLSCKNDVVIGGFQKSWLGIIAQYNHPVLAREYGELLSLQYVGGLLVKKVIVGYNFNTSEFVYSINELLNNNVKEIKSPLVFSKLYLRLIENDNVPIVIKTIFYKDNLKNDFNRSNIGKFGNQEPLSNFIYGNQPISLTQTNEPGVYNKYMSSYANIVIDYFYYENKQWNFNSETIGGNSEDWFVKYVDNFGNIIKQHLFEYPYILKSHYKNSSLLTYENTTITSSLFTSNIESNIQSNILCDSHHCNTHCNIHHCNNNHCINQSNNEPNNHCINQSTNESNNHCNNHCNTQTNEEINLFDPFIEAILAEKSKFELLINRPVKLLSDFNVISPNIAFDGQIFYNGIEIEKFIKNIIVNEDLTAVLELLNLKAPKESPSFTGNVIVNNLADFKTIPIISTITQPTQDNQIVTVKFVNDKIIEITDSNSSILLELQNLLDHINSQQINLMQLLDSKAPKDSPSFTGNIIVNGPIQFNSTVNGITKQTIGLANVDNTSDINKPISLLTQNALNLKAPLFSPLFNGNVTIDGSLNVQNTITFSSLPTISSQIIPSQDNQLVTFKYVNDIINFKIIDKIINNNQLLSTLAKILETKINCMLLNQSQQTIFNSITINNGIFTNPVFNGNIIGIDKKKIGLGNVDNTSDINKPVSNATELELNKKANINAPIFTGLVKIIDNTETSSAVTGALTVKGGVGICGGINIGKKMTVSGDSKLTNVFVENINVNSSIIFGNMQFNLNTMTAINNLVKMPNFNNLMNVDINNSLQLLLDNKVDKSYVDNAISQLNFCIDGKIDGKVNTTNTQFQKNISVNGAVISQGLNIYPILNDSNRIIEPVDQKYKIDNLIPVSYLNKNNDKREIRIDTNSFMSDLPFLLNTQHQVNAGVGQNIDQTIDYISIIGLLVKEIQDLKKIVSELKSRTD
jgi:hypothetical protein